MKTQLVHRIESASTVSPEMASKQSFAIVVAASVENFGEIWHTIDITAYSMLILNRRNRPEWQNPLAPTWRP